MFVRESVHGSVHLQGLGQPYGSREEERMERVLTCFEFIRTIR